MPTPLMMHQNGDRLTVINQTGGTVLLTDMYSEDQPNVLLDTGLGTEAQELLSGESFTATLARTLGYRDFHITIEWIDESEDRGSRTQRFM